MFYKLPPSGTPVSLSDIYHIASSRRKSIQAGDRFENKLANLTASKYVWLLNSGRTAQFVLLCALSQMEGQRRNEIVVPSWTCYSVAASIARAGLKIRPVDIDPLTMDYNYDRLGQLDFSRVLAVVACNLFGIINDWSRLRSLAAERSFFLVDDAAQSFGTSVDGRLSGTLGDVGFYSLDRGKNLSTWSGGALLSDRDDLAIPINRIAGGLRQPGFASETGTLLKMSVYSVLLRPHWYWLPSKLPFLGLGETIYDETFHAAGLSALQQRAGSLLLGRLDRFNEHRAASSEKLISEIRRLGGFEIPISPVGRRTIYLRLPVLAPDRTTRDRAVRELGRAGITASTMYPKIIRDIPGIEPRLACLDDEFPGGRQIVNRLFALPTHPYVRPKDIETMVRVLRAV
jgi:perosamine synthetase